MGFDKDSNVVELCKTCYSVHCGKRVRCDEKEDALEAGKIRMPVRYPYSVFADSKWGDLTLIPIEEAYDRCASLSTDQILNRMTPVCK